MLVIKDMSINLTSLLWSLNNNVNELYDKTFIVEVVLRTLCIIDAPCDYKRKCPIAVNDKFCLGAIRNQLESSIASTNAAKWYCSLWKLNQ